MSYKYAVIPAAEVDSKIAECAHRALAFVRKDLSLPYIYVKWFRPLEEVSNPKEVFEREADIAGSALKAHKDSIYISASLSERETMETILHESFHIAQLRGPLGFTDFSEIYAQKYAADAMRRYQFDLETYVEHLSGKDWSLTLPDAKEQAAKKN